jgi:hypothetical protein
MSLAASLLAQLEAVHRDTIFPKTFDRVQWGMVAAFESKIARVSGKNQYLSQLHNVLGHARQASEWGNDDSV